MDADIREQLQLVYAATEFMANVDGQDAMLVIEMSQAMLSDVLNTGMLADLTGYIRRYCDVIDQVADADQIVADIRDLMAREPDEPGPADYDPGPEVDDEGGMSEHRYHQPEDWT